MRWCIPSWEESESESEIYGVRGLGEWIVVLIVNLIKKNDLLEIVDPNNSEYWMNKQF